MIGPLGEGMRTISVIAAGLAAIGVSACHKEANGDLGAGSLARAAGSPEGIVLAPTGPQQTVVSTEEQVTSRYTHLAQSHHGRRLIMFHTSTGRLRS